MGMSQRAVKVLTGMSQTDVYVRVLKRQNESGWKKEETKMEQDCKSPRQADCGVPIKSFASSMAAHTFATQNSQSICIYPSSCHRLHII